MAAKSDLQERELSYLRDALFDFKEENGIVFGYCIGSSYEKIIEIVAAISSTCFIRAEVHSQEKGHRRFKSGLCFPFNCNISRVYFKGLNTLILLKAFLILLMVTLVTIMHKRYHITSPIQHRFLLRGGPLFFWRGEGKSGPLFLEPDH